MGEKTREKLNYGIYPSKLLNWSFGIISGCITIYLFITILSGTQILIAMLVFSLVLLSTFYIKTFIRLREVLISEKYLDKKLGRAGDNRDTLEKIIEEKNNEIDFLKRELDKQVAQKHYIFFMWKHRGKQPPVKLMTEVLEIEDNNKERENEQQIQNSKNP
ncbi:hypothetical protein ACWE42_15980 [Sutcliffiella cohnii]